MAQFFINRPVFAWVLSIVIMLAGGLSIFTLPLEMYPEIAPPRVTLNTTYTGASAETVENSVTQVIEQQLKGLDRLLYMSSTSDSAGRSRTTLTFEPGANIDVAQVQAQNKLQGAVNRLPDAVKSRGVFVNKGGQDYLVTYVFTSPDPNVSQVTIGDYLTSNVVDVIARVERILKPKVRSQKAYDFIIIDTPPNLGFLTINAMVASDTVLVPIQTEFFAIQGLSMILDLAKAISEGLGQDLKLKYLLTMYDARTKMGKEVITRVRELLGKDVFEVVIPRSIKLAEAPSYGKPIHLIDPVSLASKAYSQLADEVIQCQET